MDALKLQLQRIQQQLGNLSASQKMLTASLVAIMAVTIFWWAKYAGTAEMVPVVESALSSAQVQQIKTALDLRGITNKISADKILVPTDRRSEALVALSFENVLPDGAADIWDAVMKQMNPWDPQKKTDAIQTHLREQLLGEAITRYTPGVAKTRVFLTQVSERRIGGSIEPTASIQIATRGSNIDLRRLAEGAAQTVAHAVPGLAKKNVAVAINGIPCRLSDDRDMIANGDLYERIDAEEKRVREKLLSLIATPGALAAVAVQIDNTTSDTVHEGFDKDKTFGKEVSIDTTNSETPVGGQAGGDPGVVSNTQANTGLALNAAPAAPAPAVATVDKSLTKMENFADKTTTRSSTPAGKSTVVSAAVRLPRSYFVTRFKASNPSAKEPDDNALQPLVQAELPFIRNLVKNAAYVQNEESISVDMYYDGLATLQAGEDAEAPAAGMAAMVGGHAREIVIGALALLSLFMVSSIVKKGTPAPVVAPTPKPRETPRLAGMDDFAGIAGDGVATLDGMELDEDALRAQQMVEQVKTMVSENPDAAANLVKRWLNRT
jgi:flagellar biosynthesis/type III secretory pathway M-ring protein FliF/YscJ